MKKILFHIEIPPPQVDLSTSLQSTEETKLVMCYN